MTGHRQEHDGPRPATPMRMRTEGFGLIQNLRPHQMTTFQTPEPDVFSVWHLGMPEVDISSWELTIGGLVERPLTLTLDQLAEMPQTTVTSVHECAGSPLTPAVPQRRVGNVTWTGVRLAHLLSLAGVDPNARYVISTGGENGVYNKDHYDRYEKDLPLAEALTGDVLIALGINGEPISALRGGPVRLVVPGYYGTNSTKWLIRLELSTRRSTSAFTTRYYMDPPSVDGGEPTPVWKLAPNSVIVAPTDGQAHAGQPVTIWGWAWADDPITTVEVTVDGQSWQPAHVEPRVGRSWQRFSRPWTPVLGEHMLACRASTSSATQPEGRGRNQIFRQYIFVTQAGT